MTKSIRKRILSLVLICTSVIMMFSASTSAVHADASELVAPYYNNVVTVDSTAAISSSGKLTARYSYDGSKTVTTKAVVTTYVEKKNSGLYWSRVDIGTTNDEWVDTINDYAYTGSHSVQLSSKGTYRVTFKLVIYGTGGTADEITRVKEIEY